MILQLKKAILSELENRFYWIPVFIGIGIIFFFKLPYDPHPVYSIAPLSAFIILKFIFRKTYYPSMIIMACLLICVGYSSAHFRTVSLDAPKILEPLEEIWIEGDISEISYYDDGQRIILENIYTDNLLRNETPKRIRINVKSDISDVQIGERVLLRATIMPPPQPIVPNGFDFSYYLYFKQIGGIGFATSRIEVIEESKDKNSLSYYVNRVRQEIAKRITSKMDNPYSAIANGMLVGDASQIKKTDFEVIRISGIAHIIAISGMHIVTVVGMVFFSCRFLLTRIGTLAMLGSVKKVSALVAIFFSFIYLLISGSPVSAQRAFVMSSIVLTAIVFDRTAIPMRSIALAAIIILILTPEAILGASLQMSFAACIALIASYELAKNLFLKFYSRRMISKFLVYFFSVIFSTIVAGAATAPFIIYHFNQFSTYSILANVVCVPLSDFFIMPFGMIAMLLMPFHLEAIPLYPMRLGLEWMFKYAQYISSLPNASIYIPSFSNVGIGLVTIGGLSFCFFKTKLKYIGASILVAGFFCIKTIELPDVLIDGSGKIFAVKNEEGEMVFCGKRISKFAKSAWMQNLGINKFNRFKTSDICKEGVCSIQSGGKKIVYKTSNKEVSCDAFDLLINTTSTSQKCMQNKLIVELSMLKELGSHLIWFKNDDIKIDTVSNNRPIRAWNS